MSIKFLMKDLFKRKKIIVLLTLQTIVYIYFLMNFFTIYMCKNNFIESYKKNFPVNNGGFIGIKTGYNELENKRKNVLKFIDYIESNKAIKNYKLYIREDFQQQDFGIDYSKYYQRLKSSGDMEKQIIPCIKLDYTYYYEIKKYIDGQGFKEEDFKGKQEITPLILGNNFKNNYKIGELITSVDKKSKFKVVGFLNKDILVLDGDPVCNSNSLEGSFIIPLDKKELNESDKAAMALRNMIFEFRDDVNYEKSLKEIKTKINLLGLESDISIENFYDPLNKFLTDVDSQIKFELIRISMFTVLAFGSLTLAFIYLVNIRKKDIGILYAIGASRKDIILMVSFDMIFIILFGYLISLPLYIYNGKIILFFFMNDFNIKNFALAFLAMVCMGIVSLIIPCYNIIKLKPRDLIGGFRE